MTTDEGESPLVPLSRAERLAVTAESFIGSCGCVEHRDTMKEALGLTEGSYFDWRPFAVLSGKIQGVSTCGMFVGSCLSQAGITSDFLPWRIGSPLGSFTKWAWDQGIWTKYRPDLMPKRGDFLLVGDQGGTHICIVSSLDSGILTSIDGGQICTLLGAGHEGIGRQCVKKVTRTWHQGKVFNKSGSKTIVGWASL